MTDRQVNKVVTRPIKCLIDMEATGAMIKRKALEKGFTANDIKALTCVGTVQAVYKWFNGQSLPDYEKLLALSKILNTPIDKLLVYNEELGIFWGIQLSVERIKRMKARSKRLRHMFSGIVKTNRQNDNVEE